MTLYLNVKTKNSMIVLTVNGYHKEKERKYKLSNIFFIIAGLALVAFPVAVIMLIIQAIRKKPKKKIGIVCLVLVGTFFACFILSAIISCNHEWAEATCTEPSVCTKCGESKGEPLGHNWKSATYEEPKTCLRCGETVGEKLKNNKTETVKAVEAGYQRTIERAIKKGKDPDVAYNTLYNISSELKKAIENGDNEIIDWMSGQLYEEDLSTDEMYSNVKKLLKYLVPENEDKLSAIMRKFKTMDSVEGKITKKEVDIVVTDMDRFVDQMDLKTEYVGGVLAALECYDYSWVDDDAEKFLQFTDDGFTFKWKAVGNYELSL